MSGATIVVVDDDESVRRLVQRILRREGYDVLSAANGAEALVVCEQNPNIAALITDVDMPGMNGRELAQRVLALYPNIRIIYMSGHHDDEQLHEMVAAHAVVYLEKPVPRELLIRKLRELLSA
jgi:CheY-like chemotaxis protein